MSVRVLSAARSDRRRIAGWGATMIVGRDPFRAASVDGTDLPSADEVTEWARFLVVQCPACEQPEGEWREI
jgi:hypothetical protein